MFSSLGQQQQGSMFGKPAAGGLFSSVATSAPTFPSATTTQSSLFGTQPATTGLFGAKPAGQATLFGAGATQPTTGGLFGQQQQAQPAFGASTGGTSLFGQQNKPSAFRQPAAGGGGLFGQPAASVGGSMFGAQQPTTGAFGTTTTSTGMFGAPAQQAAPSFAFGQQPQQQQAAGGIFAPKPAQPFGFGAATQVVKFVPPIGEDVMQIKGTPQKVSTKQMCIATMKEYENKSLEELRVEDYIAGRMKNTDSSAAGGGTSLFGQQQAQSGGLFGKPAGGGLFSSVATSAPTFPSATTTQSSLFGAQPATSGGGLFGAKPAGQATLFGAQSTQQPAGGLFGQQQQPAPAFGAAAGGTGLFGQQQNKPSIFGQQVSQPATGGLFGQPATSGSIFGAQPATGFGATTTTTTLFGAPAQQQPATSFAFGQQPQQQQQAAGGLFAPKLSQPFGFGAGSQAAPAFGAPQGQPSLFGAPVSKVGAGSIFGAQPQQQQQQPSGIGLFGQPAGGIGLLQKPAQPNIFGATPGISGGAGVGGMFGAGSAQQGFTIGGGAVGGGSPQYILGSNVNTSAIQQAIIEAQLSTLPYGDSPLLKMSPKSPKSPSDDITSLQKQLHLSNRRTLDEQRTSIFDTQTSSAPAGTTSTLDTTSKTGGSSVDLSNSLLLDASFSYKPLVLLPSMGFGAALGLHSSPKLKTKGDSYLSRTLPEEEKSVKSLDMSVIYESINQSRQNGALEETSDLPPRLEFSHQQTPDQQTTTKQPAAHDTSISDNFSPSTQNAAHRRSSSSAVSSTTSEKQTENEWQTNLTEWRMNPSLKKTPSAAQSPETPSSTTTTVYRVKLTRPEYYCMPTAEELEDQFRPDGTCRIESGLTVGRLGYGSVFWKGPIVLDGPVDLDQVVHFRNKEVVVYPDEEQKPEVGQGLNKPAEVSLERVWPVDPRTKQQIKDSEQLRRLGFREKLERLCQRMDAVFRDYQPATGTWQFEVQHFSKYGFLEEEEDEEGAPMDSSAEEVQQAQKLQQAHMQTLVQKAKVPLREIQKSLEGTGQQQQNGAKRVIECIVDEDEPQSRDYIDFSSSTLLDDSKLFQEEVLRKKFKMDDGRLLAESKKLLNLVTAKDYGHGGSTTTVKRRAQLVERQPKNAYRGIGAAVLNGSALRKLGLISTSSEQRRSCRAGFSNDLIMTSLTPNCHPTSVNIHHLRVIPTIKNYFSAYQRARAMNVLNSSAAADGLIAFEPPSLLLRLLDSFVVQQHDARHEEEQHIERAIFALCDILCMKADNLEEKVAQRHRMGDWLCDQLSTNKYHSPQPSVFRAIFHHLTCGRRQQAIQAARKAHRYNMALLLSMYKCSGSYLVRDQVAKQLHTTNRRAMEEDYARLLELLSGNWTSVRDNCLEGLNWMQILGLLIWYHSSPCSTLLDCVNNLERLMD